MVCRLPKHPRSSEPSLEMEEINVRISLHLVSITKFLTALKKLSVSMYHSAVGEFKYTSDEMTPVQIRIC
jgi:hypothetical protein